LKYIQELIKQYTDINAILKVNTYNLDIVLTNNCLIKPLLKELSPYLRFLRAELTELEKPEEFDTPPANLQKIIYN